MRVHWLPSYIQSEFLKDTFDKIGDVKGVYRVIDPVTGIDNGIREVFLEGVDRNTIPYILRFETINFKLLVTVKGRPPYCTRCSKIGYTRKNCDTVLRQPETKNMATDNITITDSEPDIITDSETDCSESEKQKGPKKLKTGPLHTDTVPQPPGRDKVSIPQTTKPHR